MMLQDQTLTVQIRSLLNKIDNTYLPTEYRFAIILCKINSVILTMLCDKESQESRERIVSSLAKCYVELDSWAQSLLKKTDASTSIYIDVCDEKYILDFYRNISAINCLYDAIREISSAAFCAFSADKRDYKTYYWPHPVTMRHLLTAQIIIILIAAKIDLV